MCWPTTGGKAAGQTPSPTHTSWLSAPYPGWAWYGALVPHSILFPSCINSWDRTQIAQARIEPLTRSTWTPILLNKDKCSVSFFCYLAPRNLDASQFRSFTPAEAQKWNERRKWSQEAVCIVVTARVSVLKQSGFWSSQTEWPWAGYLSSSS